LNRGEVEAASTDHHFFYEPFLGQIPKKFKALLMPCRGVNGIARQKLFQDVNGTWRGMPPVPAHPS
jgi:hypothetical protein